MKKLIFFLLIAVIGYSVPSIAQSIPAPALLVFPNVEYK